MGETTSEVKPGDVDYPSVERTQTAAAQRASAQTTPASGAATGSEADAPEVAELRSGIEQTRADLSSTIDALQDKLDPSRIAEQVKEQIREKAAEVIDTAKTTVREATIGKAEKLMSNVSDTVSDATTRAGAVVKDKGSSVVQYIRENPIPFVLLGVGVGMLTISKRKTGVSSYNSSRSNGEAYGQYQGFDQDTDTSPSLTDRARDMVGSASSRARDMVGTASDTLKTQVNAVSDQARQTAQTAGNQFQSALQKNPMAVGIAALAAGAIVGLTLPSTDVESEYLGEARDRLVNQAKSVAQEAAQKVQRVTEEAGRTVKDAAQKEGLTVG